MTINSDFAEMQSASALIAEIAEALTREKARMQTQVDSLVTAGWVGQAADQYAQAWQEWVEGADRVLAALRAESGLIAQQRGDFMTTDDGVTGTMSQLSGRLGP